MQTKRGNFNEPRSVAIYLLRRLRGEGLLEICGDFNLRKYSSASSVIERLKRRMENDPQLKTRIDELTLTLYKSQAET